MRLKLAAIVATVAASLTITAAASATTYYFSNSSGSDSNACTQAAPCQTLGKVQSLTLAPGDGVAFLRGDVWVGGLTISQSGASTGRINFYGYGSASSRPLITGGQNGDCFKINGSYVNIDNLEGDSCGYAGIEVFGQHITVQNSAVKSNAAGIHVASGTSDVRITKNTVKGNNVLNQNTSSGSSGAFGILLNGPAIVTWNHISGSYAPSLAYGWDGSAIELYNASNSWVHHNTMIDNNAGVEMGGSGAGNAVEYNKISANPANMSGDGQADGIVLPGAVSAFLAHNSIDVLGSSSQGVVCYSACSPSTSVIDNAIAAGTKAFYTDNSTIVARGNVLNGTVQGITLDASNSTAPIGWVSPPADLHETCSSPTVDHGTLSDFTYDLDNQPVPDAVNTPSDSGAYELNTTNCGTTTTTTSTTPTTTSTTTTTTPTTTSTTTTTTPTTTTTTSSSSTTTTATGGYTHIVWVIMENHGYNQILNSSSATYIHSLMSTYGSATNMFAESHPSLPNYIAMTSGSTQGITDDSGPSSHPLNVENIFHQLPAGGSRSLEESMPSNCDHSDATPYAVRHNPEAYYTNLGTDCANYDVPLNATAPDLSAKFTFITPNLCHDMHSNSCSGSSDVILQGDQFLQAFVPTLLASPQYQAGNTAMFITWDEDQGSEGNHIPTIIIDPHNPHTTGTCAGIGYTHYSMLRYVEDTFGLPRIGAASSANSMAGCFGL